MTIDQMTKPLPHTFRPAKPLRECDCCPSTNDVQDVSNIYWIGSEGTKLCIYCRTAVSEFVRTMNSVKTRTEIATIKKERSRLLWKGDNEK